MTTMMMDDRISTDDGLGEVGRDVNVSSNLLNNINGIDRSSSSSSSRKANSYLSEDDDDNNNYKRRFETLLRVTANPTALIRLTKILEGNNDGDGEEGNNNSSSIIEFLYTNPALEEVMISQEAEGIVELSSSLSSSMMIDKNHHHDDQAISSSTNKAVVSNTTTTDIDTVVGAPKGEEPSTASSSHRLSLQKRRRDELLTTALFSREASKAPVQLFESLETTNAKKKRRRVSSKNTNDATMPPSSDFSILSRSSTHSSNDASDASASASASASESANDNQKMTGRKRSSGLDLQRDEEGVVFEISSDQLRSKFMGRLVSTGTSDNNEALMILIPSSTSSTREVMEQSNVVVAKRGEEVVRQQGEKEGDTQPVLSSSETTLGEVDESRPEASKTENAAGGGEEDNLVERLRESEERHRKLFESMMQGVVYQDAETGAIVAANSSAERILGLTFDQMMGRSSIDPRWKSVHEDGSDYAGDTHPSMVAIKSGLAVTDAIMGVFHPLTNSQHWISIDAIPLFAPGADRPYQVYTTFTDITEQKLAQKEIILAKEKAEEADKLKSAFLANMSHELRTPLNGLMGHIDLALSNGLDESYRSENLDGLQVAHESGKLLVAIINDILDLSKMEAGQLAIDTSKVCSVQKMVNQTLRLGNMLLNQRMTTDGSPKTNIEVTSSIHEEISPYIYADDFRVLQILNNLVSNSIKFTKNGSVDLRVRLLPSDDMEVCENNGVVENTISNNQTCAEMLEFRVRDTGRGVPQKLLSAIFEPFRQVDFSDTRKFGGTGLGLTISKKLVGLMDGTLWVESEIGKGSSFCFTIPYRRASSADAALFQSQEKILGHTAESLKSTHHRKFAPPGSSTGKVLIAEDDPVSRKIASKMVTKAGYEVVLAENGQIAVDKYIEDGTIDLILMDVQMCVMGGLEATEKIRKIEKEKVGSSSSRQIPIIALSAAAMNTDRERGAAAEMTEYLTKPVNRIELLQTLERYIGSLTKEK